MKSIKKSHISKTNEKLQLKHEITFEAIVKNQVIIVHPAAVCNNYVQNKFAEAFSFKKHMGLYKDDIYYCFAL